jgi:hypothetical protein
MGRQTLLHAFPGDVNQLVAALHAEDPLEIATKRGISAMPERLAFVPDNMIGQTLVLWSERFALNPERDFIARAETPYFLMNEQTQPVLEFSLSTLTTWDAQPALTQGRIYGLFEHKTADFEKWFERIIRYIRRHWRKNPAVWMSGYVGPAAIEWFEKGGLLLPNYIPPVRSDWILRLGDQHEHR